MSPPSQGRRNRREACTCPFCKDGEGRYAAALTSCLCLYHTTVLHHEALLRAQSYKWPLSHVIAFCASISSFLAHHPVTSHNFVIEIFFLFLTLVTRLKRSSTFVTSPAVGRYTARLRIWGLTSAGTRASGPSSAAGPFAASASHVQMSSSATRERTQVTPEI